MMKKASKKRRLDDEWAPIRIKLATRTTAQMEGGLKLSIKAQCSQKCSGPDQNVFLYHRGLRHLSRHCRGMMTAMSHNQNYSIVLEVRVDIAVNRVEFVTAQVVGNRLMLIYVEFDMLGVIVSGATGIPATATTTNNGPINMQTVSLTASGVRKLEDFILHQADPCILVTAEEEGATNCYLGDDGDRFLEVEEEEEIDEEEEISKTIAASLENGGGKKKKKKKEKVATDKATDTDDLQVKTTTLSGVEDEEFVAATTTTSTPIKSQGEVDDKEKGDVDEPNSDAMEDVNDFAYTQEIDYPPSQPFDDY
jgi:hypothetical protein